MGIVSIFFAVMLIFAWGILRNRKTKESQPRSYSILVSCRNEQKNIHSLLESLSKIDYPDYEIILVDDASEDDTFSILTDYCQKNDRASCYRIEQKDEKLRGKKAALTLAARKARKQILLLTDADCIVPFNWLQSYDKYFSDRTGMVVGFSPELDASEFRHFTQLATAAVFAAPIGLGYPFSCTGRNLAIRRDTFFAVKGFEPDGHLEAGDDKGMLNRIHKAGYPIAYNPEAPVYTLPNRKGFIDQQLRRYSKFGQSRPGYQLLMLIILAYFIILPFKIITGSIDVLVIHWLGLFIFWGANLTLHRQRFVPSNLVYLLVYPYYLIYWSIMGIVRKWNWK